MKRYASKRAVIIGGTHCMGLTTAKMLLDEGARVLVTGRSQAGLESARRALGGRKVAQGQSVGQDAGSVLRRSARGAAPRPA